MTLNGRTATLTIGFAGNKTFESVEIVRYPSADEPPFAIVRASGNIVTVHKSRLTLVAR